MIYSINNGVGRSFEFKGLRPTYFCVAAAGLLGGIIFYFIVSALFPFIIAMILTGVAIGGSLFAAFYLNKKFGETGLSKLRASMATKELVLNRKRVKDILTKGKK
jgi:hypothetical protein